MSPLENYLERVRAHLPKTGRDDVIEELREALTDLLERRGAEADHQLSESEQQQVLRSFGHPVAVGARYWTGKGILFGPLSPFYRTALAWVLGSVIFVQSAIAAGRILAQGQAASAVIHALIPQIIGTLVLGFLIMTVVFLALDAGRSLVKRR